MQKSARSIIYSASISTRKELDLNIYSASISTRKGLDLIVYSANISARKGLDLIVYSANISTRKGLAVTPFIHYLFDTSRVYTIVKITLKQNYMQLYVS